MVDIVLNHPRVIFEVLNARNHRIIVHKNVLRHLETPATCDEHINRAVALGMGKGAVKRSNSEQTTQLGHLGRTEITTNVALGMAKEAMERSNTEQTTQLGYLGRTEIAGTSLTWRREPCAAAGGRRAAWEERRTPPVGAQ